MRFRDDDRAVTVQIGAVLLFATLIIALSLYQATVVPSQNADVEYKHSQTVQNQLTDVRNGLLRSAATGNPQPASVSLGTQYPSRVFLMNPPPATGTLRTGSYDNGTIRVSNVEATNPETRDFLNGEWTASTKYLGYEPDYNEYDNAPNLRYESSVLSNVYPSADGGTAIPLTDQLLVDNETRTITLVTLNGSLSTSRASSVTVTPETLSAPYQRVQVTNRSDDPVNVSVPARVSASQLENRTDLGGHPGVVDVVDVPDEDRVVVQVAWSDRFTLQTARVGVGSRTENPPPHYLTLVENRGDRVTVEARDRFNNAESGVRVDASDESLFVDSPVWTDESGRATFEVANNESGDAVLSILDNDTVRERVSVTVDATAGGAGGGGDGGGGGGGGDGGDTSANDRMELVSDSGGTFWNGVSFDVENTGNDSVDIEAVTLEGVSGSQVAELSETQTGSYSQGQHEVYVAASTDGVLDMDGTPYYEDPGTPLPFGQAEPMTETGTVNAETTATVYLSAFRNSGGSKVNMQGRTVEITLYYGDGTSETYAVDVN